MSNKEQSTETKMMVTTTIRMRKAHAEAIDMIAHRDRVKQSEVLRIAISSYLHAEAENDPAVVELLQGEAQRELNAKIVELQQELGANALAGLRLPDSSHP